MKPVRFSENAIVKEPDSICITVAFLIIVLPDVLLPPLSQSNYYLISGPGRRILLAS